jgi:hypothetical protein
VPEGIAIRGLRRLSAFAQHHIERGQPFMTSPAEQNAHMFR